jgi:predicted nucleotidyltransferase
MMNINAIPEPWRSFLSEIDAALEEETSFHCIGGFVITMLYGFDRTTADVDVILINPRDPDLKLISLAGKRQRTS